MKWTEFSDYSFCRAYGHLFAIRKPEYRNDIIEWFCKKLDDDTIIAEGKTLKITVAKNACKDVFKQLKAADKSIYVKPNNKLTRKRYARQVGSQVSGAS
jgi:hypothetical protein